jgi:adenine-specific DNA-methyltransferase
VQSKETNRQIGPLDDKVGHYVKILCDEIFGREHFINDITRIKCNPKNFKRKAYGNVKDRILFYVKSNQYVWNEVYEEITKNDLHKRFKKQDKKAFIRLYRFTHPLLNK